MVLKTFKECGIVDVEVIETFEISGKEFFTYEDGFGKVHVIHKETGMGVGGASTKEEAEKVLSKHTETEWKNAYDFTITVAEQYGIKFPVN